MRKRIEHGSVALKTNPAMQMCLQESNEVHLSALGVAMSSLVTVAEILKARQLVVVKSLCTMLERFDDRSPKPKVRVG